MWRNQVESFKAARRASIGLGNPEGKLLTFAEVEGRGYAILHYRNSGQGRADHLFAQNWPFVGDTFNSEIPAFNSDYVKGIGIRLQPGVTFDSTVMLAASNPDPVMYGHEAFSILSRVSYWDEFGDAHCESFCVEFRPEFMPYAQMCTVHQDYCDGKPHK